MTEPFAKFVCQGCGHDALVEVTSFPSLPRITSDCRPFPTGGRLSTCSHCGAAQKFPDERWQEEISEIYANYTSYSQGGGIEQVVIDSASGQLRRRSEVIVRRLLDATEFPKRGAMLDVGCGGGTTLRVMSEAKPEWTLYGAEIGDQGHEHLKTIPRFAELYTCPPSQIQRKFDLITSVHSLEHFSDPFQMLVDLRTLLSPRGILFVQLYNTAANPFDAVIADHLMHFTASSLRRIVERAGFEVRCTSSDWIAKELSLIAVPGTASDFPPTPADAGIVRSNVAWLGELVAAANSAADAENFGLFGTSISATWLFSGVRERVCFFVDEDPHRYGRDYCGRPVLRPEDVPAGATVYLALTPAVASIVHARLRHLAVHFILPPSS